MGAPQAAPGIAAKTKRNKARGGKEEREEKSADRPSRPSRSGQTIEADENEPVGLTLIAGSERFRKTFAFGRWMSETDNMRAFRISARRRKSYTLFSVFITISAQRGKANPKRLVPARQGLALAAIPETCAAAGRQGSNTGRGRPLCVGGDSSPKPRRIFVAS